MQYIQSVHISISIKLNWRDLNDSYFEDIQFSNAGELQV